MKAGKELKCNLINRMFTLPTWVVSLILFLLIKEQEGKEYLTTGVSSWGGYCDWNTDGRFTLTQVLHHLVALNLN